MIVYLLHLSTLFLTSSFFSSYVGSFPYSLLSSPKYYSGDKIEKNEISGACRTYGGKERHIPCFGGET